LIKIRRKKLSTVDLKAQLLSLVNLQKLDSEIYALNNEKAAKPLEIKAIEEAFEVKKQNLAQLEKNSLEQQKQRKERELELASNAEAIKKLQGQLYSLKTNKEFQTMLQQIADTKADGSLIEEKILLSFEESDKIKAQIEQENIRLKEEEKLFLEQKRKVQIRVNEIDERMNQLRVQRQQIIPGIERRCLPNTRGYFPAGADWQLSPWPIIPAGVAICWYRRR
jgi:predicted  nucleic acid-binding Zn-ribbon protein